MVQLNYQITNMLDVIKLLILNGADVNITERVPNRGFEKHSLITMSVKYFNNTGSSTL